MKKFLSLLLTLAMMLALVGTAIPAVEKSADADSLNLLDVSATDLNGNAFSGSVFGQYDLTLLNVWATWCGPCIGEMPSLQQIYTQLESRGINIVGLLFNEDAATDALGIINENGLTYRTLLPGKDSKLNTLKNVTSIPVTYYVNRDGNICTYYTHVGSDSYDGWIQNIVSIMYWEYGIEMTDLAPLPDPTTPPDPTPTSKPVDDATYTFDDATGTLTVSGTGTGDYDLYHVTSSTKFAPWYEIRNSVKHIVVNEGFVYLGRYAFQDMDILETVSLPSSLRYIGTSPFYSTELGDLVIPEGVTTMESQSSSYFTTLSLPSTLVNLPGLGDMSYFYYCTKLTSITAAPGNPVVCSVDGVLYSKDKKQLLCYPAVKSGTEYTTLPETEVIGTFAFQRSARLKTIKFSKNVNNLYEDAIYNMSLVKELYFYGNCPTVAPNAIESCVRLANVYYAEGTTGWGSTFCGFATSTFKPVTTLLGDVNGDTSVTQTDALLLLRTLAGWTTTIDTAAADINGDTSVTQTDALLLLRYLAGWPVAQFPA